MLILLFNTANVTIRTYSRGLEKDMFLRKRKEIKKENSREYIWENCVLQPRFIIPRIIKLGNRIFVMITS